MISINTLFQIGSNQIEYKGKTINKFFEIDNHGEYIIKFFFISVNSHFNQAIVLFFNDFIGEYYLFNQKRHLPQNRFQKENFWYDTAPNEIEIKIILKEGNILICNGSDPLGTKQICHSLHSGCAIYIEKISDNRYRFNCARRA